MLRGSITKTGENFEMAALNGGETAGGVAQERELLALTDAVIHRERDVCDRLRGELEKAVGAKGVADACAIIAAFQGFNRIADSVGTGVDPAQHDMLVPIRGSIGLDEFYRANGA